MAQAISSRQYQRDSVLFVSTSTKTSASRTPRIMPSIVMSSCTMSLQPRMPRAASPLKIVPTSPDASACEWEMKTW